MPILGKVIGSLSLCFPAASKWKLTQVSAHSLHPLCDTALLAVEYAINNPLRGVCHVFSHTLTYQIILLQLGDRPRIQRYSVRQVQSSLKGESVTCPNMGKIQAYFKTDLKLRFTHVSNKKK